jgi:hypothetical protein
MSILVMGANGQIQKKAEICSGFVRAGGLICQASDDGQTITPCWFVLTHR